MVADLSNVGEVTRSKLTQWLRTHGNNVRQSTVAGSPAEQTGKPRSYSIHIQNPPIPCALSTELLISNPTAARIFK